MSDAAVSPAVESSSDDAARSQTRTAPAAVSLRDVRKSYGGVAAVDGVDLEIAQGEFFTMLGPSGSGKTTLLRMIAGFERPDGGSIELGGVDVTRTPPYARNVNTVFQDYALFPHMNVLENVEYGLRVKRVARADAPRRAAGGARRWCGCPGSAPASRSQLSGGQRQRVALARAIVNEPEVLLLDEPLGALDLKLRQEMQLELKRIQREVGITFVFVTHDQEEALTMSDRLVVLNHGRDRAARHAGRGLRAPRERVRRRLHRRLQPARARAAGASRSAPRRSACSTPASRPPPASHVERGQHRGRHLPRRW